MKFKGTIIITDPCYIVKDIKECLKEAGVTIEHPRVNDGDIATYSEAIQKYYEQVSSYDDWDRCDYGDNMEALGITNYISESTIYGDWSCATFTTPRSDVEKQVEELCDLGHRRYEAIKEYGSNSIQIKVYDNKLNEAMEGLTKAGNFCADSGMVAVFLLDEVLKYNPNILKYIEDHPWCFTVIQDFDGDVQYYLDNSGAAHIIGKGNINFFTLQTGE